MLSYNTTLHNIPPQAIPAPNLESPFARYGSAHQDMLKAQMGVANANYAMDREKANTDYAMKQQEAERQLVLQGLQQMNAAQQNQNSIANARLGNVSSLLSGLFT